MDFLQQTPNESKPYRVHEISMVTIQGVPIKVTEFQIEITLEIFGLGNQF